MIENKFYSVLDFINEKWFSDIHIWEDQKIYVRNEIGEMKRLSESLSKDEIFWFTNDLLCPSEIDALLEWKEIDSAYTHKDARYRLNIYHDKYGINIALRRISSEPPTCEQIKMPAYLNKYYMQDKWLILVTWPTWSGKSTTLASIVRYINENKRAHIITLEDPIEYIYKSDKCRITQREIWKSTPSWQNGIKYALRQDPDVILIWEMRDYESISAVLTLVETWHLVLATLHTTDAISTITRIIDVFPTNQQPQAAIQLSLNLSVVISQRLFPNKDLK